MLRPTIMQFIEAYGRFNDMAAPILESVAAISLAFLLGGLYGLNGVLAGMMLPTAILIFVWKPYFLYKTCFMEDPKRITFSIIFKLLLTALLCIVSNFIISKIPLPTNLYQRFIMVGISSFIVYGVISYGLFYMLFNSFRSSYVRLSTILKTYIKWNTRL